MRKRTLFYQAARCRDCVFCRKLLKIGNIPGAVCTINLRYKNASYESDFIAKETTLDRKCCSEFKPNQTYRAKARGSVIIEGEVWNEEKSVARIRKTEIAVTGEGIAPERI